MQTGWVRLQAVFASADLRRQLPSESTGFRVRPSLGQSHSAPAAVTHVACAPQEIDIAWRDAAATLSAAHSFPAAARQDSIAKRLQRAPELLDAVQRGLGDYLEAKRLHFPRFFFLCDEDLLQMLAGWKDVSHVQCVPAAATRARARSCAETAR